ncbi:multidrug effflux MFS transporter [Tianweitania sp. BSSL-BM11]|uniref:Bcr/CflA family efflux transporter n=1 Tax=Tianweitania aestuarii TaxID=2814886 RepID=A0ABS5RWZ3_9HYPH|nr:multidrug effflux MFS transporter [Tianweitania aestuarii]MBS9721554.1 multidrug effflux MFS transporter [Tianweitania aestuarii]
MNIQPQFTTAKQPLMSERRVALIGAILVAIGPASMALFTPAMPEIVRAFGTTEQMVKLTLTLYFAGFAFAQLICGPLSDGWGRRPVTIAFMGIYCVASAVALFAPSVEVLIVSRFIQGVGAAVGVAISRAVVRDLFTRDQSARIMNLIGLILGVAPAAAPTIGGLTMEAFGWHAIFILMFAAGAGIAIIVYTSLRETVVRDLSRVQPKALVGSYATLLKSRYFLFSAIVVGGTTGAVYAQATALPFILMTRVGLTPSQFGVGMLMQSGFYFVGNLVVRQLMRRMHAAALVPIGLCFTTIGITTLFCFLNLSDPTFLKVMGPIAFASFGLAFIMPAMTTASLAPFPHIAGAASALAGFFQMGSGMVGGLLIATFSDPVMGLATVVPVMGVTSIISWFLWRRLPEPALASVKTNAVVPDSPQS